MTIPVLADYQDFGTVVIYRDLILRNCITEMFDQEAVYDESKTDLLYSRFKVSVIAYVSENDDCLGPVFSKVNNDRAWDNTTISRVTPSLRVDGIRRYLMAPRYRLEMYNEGNQILKAQGPEPGLTPAAVVTPVPAHTIEETDGRYSFDVDNGPKPLSCNVQYVAGFKSYRIQFTIECTLIQCDGEQTQRQKPTNAQGSVQAKENKWVLSNRWHVTETMDEAFYTTRVTRGTLVVKSNTAWPHSLRHLCLPMHVRGYQRRRVQFSDSKDGCKLNYEITDVQRYAGPPKPAVDWRGTHTETVTGFGELGYGTCSVWLKGGPGTRKGLLFTSAVNVLQKRLGSLLITGLAGETIIPVSLVLVDTLHENELELTATVQRLPGEGGVLATKWSNLLNSVVGNLPAANANAPADATDDDNDRDDNTTKQTLKDPWPTPNPWDNTVPIRMFAKYFQTNCDPYHGMVQGYYGADPMDTSNLESGTLPTDPGPYSGTETNEPASGPDISYAGENDGSLVDDSAVPDNLGAGHKVHIYSHYEIECSYFFQQGKYHLPKVSANGNESVFAVAHDSTCTRKVEIRATRAGARPILPEIVATLTDSNSIVEHLLDHSITPYPPELSANGQLYMFKTDMELTYGLERVPTVAEKLRSGSYPMDTTTITTNEYVHSTHDDNDGTPTAAERIL